MNKSHFLNFLDSVKLLRTREGKLNATTETEHKSLKSLKKLWGCEEDWAERENSKQTGTGKWTEKVRG